MKLHFALVGNQNCGKSTLFNYLTGSNQHVGNFPGVTVQKKEGTILAVPDAGVIDLPGIYSLSPYTSEEIVTRDLLLYNKPDAIINVIDATNIERSLYLSLQLIELNIPMVIALNMMYELTGSGGAPDLASLFSPLTAYTFLVFCLLYPPCVAALATIRRELNSDTSTLCLMGYELVVAWCVAFVVRQIGLMLGFA